MNTPSNFNEILSDALTRFSKKTNADLLRAMSDEELADKIYNELAMFPSKSSLLQYLEQTAEP